MYGYTVTKISVQLPTVGLAQARPNYENCNRTHLLQKSPLNSLLWGLAQGRPNNIILKIAIELTSRGLAHACPNRDLYKNNLA